MSQTRVDPGNSWVPTCYHHGIGFISMKHAEFCSKHKGGPPKIVIPQKWMVKVMENPITPPQNKHGTWKWTVGKGDSYWKPSFPGSMLIFWGCKPFISWSVAWLSREDHCSWIPSWILNLYTDCCGVCAQSLASWTHHMAWSERKNIQN